VTFRSRRVPTAREQQKKSAAATASCRISQQNRRRGLDGQGSGRLAAAPRPPTRASARRETSSVAS
jgi:hypothetical protein